MNWEFDTEEKKKENKKIYDNKNRLKNITNHKKEIRKCVL
jgi:hypothetical protein